MTRTAPFLADDLLDRMRRELPPDLLHEAALPSYSHGFAPLRAMARMRSGVLASMAAERLGPGAAALDFGCGLGVLFPAVAPRCGTLYGVDLRLDAARLTVQHYGLGNVRLLPPQDMAQEVREGSLDLVVAGEVLEHLEAPEPVLDFFRSRLKPAGRLLASLPTENRLYRLGRRLAGFSGHYHHHDAHDVDATIRASGFLHLATRSLPLPGPLAVYKLLEYAPSPTD